MDRGAWWAVVHSVRESWTGLKQLNTYKGRNILNPYQWVKVSILLHSLLSHFVVIQLQSRVWLWPHGLQKARLSCPSLSPWVYSNSCPLSWWFHPTISSSVIPFSSCLQSFPAPGTFQMSQFFSSSGQSIGVSALSSFLPMNIQDWFPLGWTGCIFLLSKGLKGLFQHRSSKASVLQHSAFFIV